MESLSVVVKAFWDDEADVWTATSEDVPGLVTEASSVDDLVAKLKVMVPELLAENGQLIDEHQEVPIDLMSHLRFPSASLA